MSHHEALPRPIMRADVLRRAVNEWTSRGCTVVVEPDGKMTISPPRVTDAGDEFDLADLRR